MYAEITEHNDIEIHLDEGDKYTDEWDAMCDIANLWEVNFLDFCNEGAPVNLGNMYAEREFTAYVDGLIYTFPFGPNEFDELMQEGEVILYQLHDNYLPDMPDFIRPEWAA